MVRESRQQIEMHGETPGGGIVQLRPSRRTAAAFGHSLADSVGFRFLFQPSLDRDPAPPAMSALSPSHSPAPPLDV